MMMTMMAAQMRVAGGEPDPDAQSVLANLISWWDFEQASGFSFTDSHGSNHLTTQVGVGGISTDSGKVGRSTAFSGSTDFTYMDNSSSFAFGNESFTVFLWHYPVSGEPTTACIASKYFVTGDQRSYDLTRSSTGNFAVSLSSDGSSITMHQGPAKSPVDTAFNFLAFGYNAATDKGFLIVDGVRSEFTHAGGVYAASTAQFCIGARRSNVNTVAVVGFGRHDSSGVISTAITDAEYAVLYNAGAGLNYAGLVALT